MPLSFNKPTFKQLAGAVQKPGAAVGWSAPHAIFDLGGKVAVWVEQGSQVRLPAGRADTYPWLVLHGGPGGSLGAAHVAPLRLAGVPWFGFDQRNSGLSEDLDFSEIDFQRFVDDALEVADQLGVAKFHILGGSWGGTLALGVGAYRPERVASMVLRAPFIPLRTRVNDFFEALENIDPDYFAQCFGPGARTVQVCECFDVATPEKLLELSIAWARLEAALLTGKTALLNSTSSSVSDVQADALVRKYRLQAHFLKHDCFISSADWGSMISECAKATWPLTIVQGLNDRVCPPDGSRMLRNAVLRSTLVELPNTGHLVEASRMRDAIAEQVLRHQMARTD